MRQSHVRHVHYDVGLEFGDEIHSRYSDGHSRTWQARALVMISTITLGYARDVVLAGGDLHPQQQQIIQAIERSERTDLPSLEALANDGFSLADEGQLRFDLDVLLRGPQERLNAGPVHPIPSGEQRPRVPARSGRPTHVASGTGGASRPRFSQV